MPLYEYECRSCGTVTDIRHGFDESVSEACPACGGELMRRFSPTGIVFKGSGFYITDSRKSNGATSGKSKGSPEKSPAEKAPADANAPKPDAASAAKPDGAGAAGKSTAKGDSSAA